VGRRGSGIGGVGGVLVVVALVWGGCSRLCGKAPPVSTAAPPTLTPSSELTAKPPKSAKAAGEFAWRAERIATGQRVFANRSALIWASWTDGDDTSIYVDSSAPRLLMTFRGSLQKLAADDTAAYVASDRRITRVSLSGGTPAVVQWATAKIHSLVIAGESVYWCEHDFDKKRGRIMVGAKRGGAPRTLATLTDASMGLSDIAVSADGSVYWGQNDNLMVLRKGQTVPVVDATDVRVLTVDASHVYYGKGGGGIDAKLYRHATPVGPIETVLAGGWRGEHSLQVVGDYVYGTENAWTMRGFHPPYLARVRKAGGAFEYVAKLRGRYWVDVFSDGQRFYWADSDTREIFEAPIE
jgi:hypothetical protein